jgi:5'-3' exonuclease
VTIHIHDANGVIRRSLEADRMGRFPRSIFTRMTTVDEPNVWVFDGRNSLAKRRELYPAYKDGRKPPREDFYPMLHFIKEVLAFTRAIVVEVPGYEADDIVATLAKRYEPAGVHINSNDRDFLALQNERIKCDATPLTGVEASEVRLYKTLVGDPSDNIKGLKGFGPKAWEGLNQEDRVYLQLCFQHDLPPGATADKVMQRIQVEWSTLKTYWDIVGFYDVDLKLIEDHMVIGSNNVAEGDAYLKRFHH